MDGIWVELKMAKKWRLKYKSAQMSELRGSKEQEENGTSKADIVQKRMGNCIKALF